MPGRQLPLAVDPHQKVVGLLALERDRPQPAMGSQARSLESDHRQNPQSLSKRITARLMPPSPASRGARDPRVDGTPQPPGGPRRPPNVPCRPRASGAPPAEGSANGGRAAPVAR